MPNKQEKLVQQIADAFMRHDADPFMVAHFLESEPWFVQQNLGAMTWHLIRIWAARYAEASPDDPLFDLYQRSALVLDVAESG